MFVSHMRSAFLAALFVCILTSDTLANYESAQRWFISKDADDRVFTQISLILNGNYNGLADGIFGRHTYRALLDFQRELGLRQTGVLSARQEDILLRKAADIYTRLGIDFFEDPIANVKVPIPFSIMQKPKTTRRGHEWKSRHGDIEIATLSIPGNDQTYFEIYSKMIAENSRRKVTYSTVQRDFFVASGILDGRRFYVKFHEHRGETRGFSISWSTRSDLLGSRLAVFMASLTSVIDQPQRVAPNQPVARNRPQAPKRSSQFGSGFYVSNRGLVVTNAHVIEGCEHVRIVQHPMAKVARLGVDENFDLAVLRVSEPAPEKFAKIRQDRPRLGESVVVAGFPQPTIVGTSLQVHPGVVNLAEGIPDNDHLFSVTASVQAGNSGGPVLDQSGNVIGVVVAKLNELKMLAETGASLSNYNFAIRSDVLWRFLEPYKGIRAGGTQAAGTVEAVAAKSAEFTVQIECY